MDLPIKGCLKDAFPSSYEHTPSLWQGFPSPEEGGWANKDEDIIKRRLLGALFLTFWNLANYHIVVMNLATVDVPGVICITAIGVSRQHVLYHYSMCIVWSIMWLHFISAWALALSVQLQ